ncbi:hypothetical protein [Phaeovulum sp.]|uniref:hypothetical protein n=1 Tax=Phaeovulum sp. TaxID=2934796 RepID=UPI003561CC77
MLYRSFLSLALGAALVATSAIPASALDRRVRIVNNTGYTMVEFYGSHTDAKTWQEDILGRDVLSPYSSVNVNFDDGTGYCIFDFKAIFNNGREAVDYNINVCEIGSFTYN